MVNNLEVSPGINEEVEVQFSDIVGRRWIRGVESRDMPINVRWIAHGSAEPVEEAADYLNQ